MNIEQQEQRHLERLLQAPCPTEFGVSFVQRTCGIGYNNALHVVRRGERLGVLEAGALPGRYQIRK